MNSSRTVRRRSTSAGFTFAFFVISVSGCETVRPIATNQVTPAQFVYDGWRLGSTTAEIQNRLGTPVHLRVREVENRHVDGQIDEIRELEYDGLVLKIYKVSEVPERELLMTIAVTSPRYEIGWGLKVGTNKEDVRRVLGNGSENVDCRLLTQQGGTTPAHMHGDCIWEYSDGDAGSEVTFSFEKDRVYRIDWSFYVD
jgi:hypothetical protein